MDTAATAVTAVLGGMVTALPSSHQAGHLPSSPLAQLRGGAGVRDVLELLRAAPPQLSIQLCGREEGVQRGMWLQGTCRQQLPWGVHHADGGRHPARPDLLQATALARRAALALLARLLPAAPATGQKEAGTASRQVVA